jgi:hypothetical protein
VCVYVDVIGNDLRDGARNAINVSENADEFTPRTFLVFQLLLALHVFLSLLLPHIFSTPSHCMLGRASARHIHIHSHTHAQKS